MSETPVLRVLVSLPTNSITPAYRRMTSLQLTDE